MKNILRSFVILRILTFILIVWGAVVRSTGSGLGCPDWPMCHGQIVPHFAWQTFIEWFHRVLAGAVSIVTVILYVQIRQTDSAKTCLQWRPLAVLFLLAAQVGLGGMAVLTDLHAHVVASHMALALLFYGSILSMWQRIEHLHAPVLVAVRPDGVRLVWLAWCAVGAIYGQSVLGAFVSASHAGLACPDFPTCLGSWWPAMIGPVALHMAHRVGALFTGTVVLLFAATCLRRSDGLPKSGLCFAIIGSVLLQIALGASNVLTGLPPVLDIAHTAVAAGLFAMVVIVLQQLRLRTEQTLRP